MNTQKFISLVKSEIKNNWQNSDIPSNIEDMMEEMAEHFRECEDCAQEFDDQEYRCKTLMQLAGVLNGTELEDWICQ